MADRVIDLAAARAARTHRPPPTGTLADAKRTVARIAPQMRSGADILDALAIAAQEHGTDYAAVLDRFCGLLIGYGLAESLRAWFEVTKAND